LTPRYSRGRRCVRAEQGRERRLDGRLLKGLERLGLIRGYRLLLNLLRLSRGGEGHDVADRQDEREGKVTDAVHALLSTTTRPRPSPFIGPRRPLGDRVVPGPGRVRRCHSWPFEPARSGPMPASFIL